MLNGLLLFGAELLRRRAPQTRRRTTTRGSRAQVELARRRSAIGAAQALALIPGFSRSGATMGGGLLVGLSNKDAARFAFLLATPIIGAAALLKLPELVRARRATACAARRSSARSAPPLTAYLSVRFLMRYFETNTLTPFAIYCFVAGLGLHDLLRVYVTTQ